MYYVYCCTCKTTGKSYIGITNNIERRWNEHRNRKSSKMLFHRAVLQFGQFDFMTKVLYKTNNRRLGFEKEREFISRHNTRHPNGYNLTEGGQGHTGCVSSGMSGRKHTDETKAKMKLAHTKRNQTGGNNPMFGKKLSEERRGRISEFMKGNQYSLGCKLSDEHVEKIRKANLGRCHSETTKRKMSLARKEYWARKRGVLSHTK